MHTSLSFQTTKFCSQFSANDSLKDLQHKIQDFESGSFWECEDILNTSIDVEEVEHALRTLKPKRSGGPDNLSPEHLNIVSQSLETGYVKF